MISWDDMVNEEPELLDLYTKASILVDSGNTVVPFGHFCGNEAFYKYFRDPLSRLAGPGARNPALRSPEAARIAYKKIYDAIPDCRGCGCQD